MPDIIANQLTGMGPIGAVIAALLITISALAAAVVFLFRQNSKLHLERRAESGALIKVIEANNTALTKNTEAADERNRVTSELADSLKVLAGAFELVTQRVDFHHNDNKEKLKDLIDVVGSVSEALRNNTGTLAEVRNGHTMLAGAVNELKAKADVAFGRRAR